jgi:PAS domain S-box-containing protein
MLIVEDDEIAGEALRSALSRRYPDLTLHLAASGTEGLRLFKSVKPGIVMTDIQMPQMNGIEMAREMRALDRDTRIIVITAHSDSELLMDCINIDVSRYLVKPVANEFLFEAVDDCLERIALEQMLKTQHQELVKGGNQLRLALESAALGTCDFRLDTGETVWDARCREMFGLEAEGPVDYHTARSRIHPDDRAIIDLAVARASAGANGGAYHEQFRVVRSDGSLRWIAVHGQVYQDALGVKRFVAANLDITDRVSTTEQLQESEARYRGLFSSLQEGCALFEGIIGSDGVDYRFLEVNTAFERLTGLSRSQLLGSTLGRVFPDLDERWLSCLGTVATCGTPAMLEYHVAASDRHYEVQLYAPAKGQVAALYLDVSERRTLQMEREKTERLESLGVLAGGIAHDFNNILMAIAGNISLARMQIDSGSAADNRLEDSEKAVAKAAALTRQLLTFARGGEPSKKSLDTAALIREAASLFLSGGNCRADLELPDDLWCLHADAGQIHQALNNLILNAVQSMPGGGILKITARNEVLEAGSRRDLAAGRYLKVGISDQGCGIPAEHLDRIFDPYFTTKATGSGLGLASVFSIIKRHEGSIGVSSVSGAGTCFELYLPASSQAAEADGDAAAALQEAAAPPENERSILVMDDEEMIRKLAQQMLDKLGYQATTCRDGAEAVSLYQSRYQSRTPFAAVILDMTVPGGMGGKEAAHLIRSIDEDAILVISSGYSSDPFIDDNREVQVNGVVAKPYSLKQLSDELKRVMGNA